MSRRSAITTLSALLLGASLAANTQAAVLYDDTLNDLPSDQGWLAFATDDAGGQSSVAGVGAQVFSDQGDSTGYANWLFLPGAGAGFAFPVNGAFPDLDPSAGFSLSFELQMLSEDHSGSDDRAGFSVILLGNDNMGIELGFWEDRVWAQADAPLFTRAEEALIDTLAAEVLYELSIVGGNYALSANGNPLLGGATRDYQAFGGSPYILPNFVFLGDDTSSAGAEFILGRVAVNDDLSVPLPAVWLLLLSGWVGMLRWRGRVPSMWRRG